MPKGRGPGQRVQYINLEQEAKSSFYARIDMSFRGKRRDTEERMRNTAVGIALTLVIVCVDLIPKHATAQSTEAKTNWRLERQSLERVLADDLQSVADWCRANAMPNHAAQTFAWHQRRDTKRQFIFLPSENSRPLPRDSQSRQWLTKLEPVLDSHGNRVFELAKRAAKADAGATAYQLLHEVLYYSPDHSVARALLGHRKTEHGWQVSSDRLKIKKSNRPHPMMSWETGTFLIASTPHFNIASRADETTTKFLAEKLERWHDVWRQVMFEFWSRPGAVSRWIDGKGKARKQTRKFDVVFFANREQYVNELQSRVKGVENSTGYYNDSNKTSYFYASEDVRILETWHHELTHQLFQEAIRAKPAPFDGQFIWLGEGIAMYFESLTDFGPYVTLGGFESRRLQFSRIRRLREGFYVDSEELSKMSRKAFQLREDMPLLYSQSAGLTHMLMDGSNGADQQKLIEFLQLLYKGKLKADSFTQIIGKSFQELDEQYIDFLAIDSNRVENFLSQPFKRTELALPKGKLTDEALNSVGNCENLQWLDLTANLLTGSKLKPVAKCKKLGKLFLTNCAIDANSLKALESLDNLTELDLSGSSVSDQMLSASTFGKNLSLLRMTKTRVSDAGLQSLARFRKLELLDVSDTHVTQAGIAALKERLPNLEIIQ